MCGSKSCLLATVPFPKWKRAPLATLPDHTSVLLGDFRRTVSRARISTSALPAFGASCAELHIAKNRVNTSKHWTITILVLPPVVARLSWQIMADIRILAGNNYQLLICRVTGHVVFGPISTSPVTAFGRSRPAADASREVVQRWLLDGLDVSVGHRRCSRDPSSQNDAGSTPAS